MRTAGGRGGLGGREGARRPSTLIQRVVSRGVGSLGDEDGDDGDDVDDVDDVDEDCENDRDDCSNDGSIDCDDHEVNVDGDDDVDRTHTLPLLSVWEEGRGE